MFSFLVVLTPRFRRRLLAEAGERRVLVRLVAENRELLRELARR